MASDVSQVKIYLHTKEFTRYANKTIPTCAHVHTQYM